MGMNAITLRVMPSSPDADLAVIESKIKEKIEKEGGKINKIEREEIAFGLKALIVTLAWPDSKDSDVVENLVSSIEHLSSVELVDVRKAFG